MNICSRMLQSQSFERAKYMFSRSVWSPWCTLSTTSSTPISRAAAKVSEVWTAATPTEEIDKAIKVTLSDVMNQDLHLPCCMILTELQVPLNCKGDTGSKLSSIMIVHMLSWSLEIIQPGQYISQFKPCLSIRSCTGTMPKDQPFNFFELTIRYQWLLHRRIKCAGLAGYEGCKVIFKAFTFLRSFRDGWGHWFFEHGVIQVQPVILNACV